jgi:hypothetical protein
MRHTRNPKKRSKKRSVTSTTVKLSVQDAEPEEAGPPRTDSHSRASTPSTNASSKTFFVGPPLAFTKLEQDDPGHDEEVEEYSPHDPYFTPSAVPQTKTPIHDPGIEPAEPHVIELWEKNLRQRLEQAYPRMCYYFFCDKNLFVLVTLLTLRRIAKADALSGKPVGGGRRDRQFVDDIAWCMSDAETRFDKDEECEYVFLTSMNLTTTPGMTWWRETLLTVQGGLHRGWIHADSPVSSARIRDIARSQLTSGNIEHCVRQADNAAVSNPCQSDAEVEP